MRFRDDEAIDLLEDAWAQFSCETSEDGWQSDGALSTLEQVADFLVERGRLVRHPTRPWFKFPEPPKATP